MSQTDLARSQTLSHGVHRTNALADAKHRSEWSIAARRFARNKLALVGAAVIVVLMVCAVFAPLLAPQDPTKMHPRQRLASPGASFLLGSDEMGRDIVSRLIYGARISLEVSLLSVGIALVVGTTLGTLAGFYPGWIDNGVMRLMDVIFAFPDILLAIAIMAVLGSSLRNVMLAIGIVYIPIFARTTRAMVLTVKEQPYVEAARSIGVSGMRLAARHILPNAAAPILVQVTLLLGFAIVVEAALSFLGLGTQPPNPSWGIMLSDGRGFMEVAPWLAIFPGVTVFLAVLSFNIVGDALREALDPNLR